MIHKFEIASQLSYLLIVFNFSQNFIELEKTKERSIKFHK